MTNESGDHGRLLLTWQVRLLAHDPARLVLLVSVILALLPLLYVVLGHLPGALLLWGAAVLSVVPALLPITYTLYEKGILVQRGPGKRFRPWGYFARCSVDETGVFLSPFSAPRRLDAFRGVYLRATDNRDAILEIVQDRLKALDVEIPGEIWYTRDATAGTNEHGTTESSTPGRDPRSSGTENAGLGAAGTGDLFPGGQ